MQDYERIRDCVENGCRSQKAWNMDSLNSFCYGLALIKTFGRGEKISAVESNVSAFDQTATSMPNKVLGVPILNAPGS